MSDTTTTPTPDEIVRKQVEACIGNAGTALDPYLLHATKVVGKLRKRPGGILSSLGLPEGMIEGLGITEDSINEHAEESMTATAVSELLVDLMHFCKARGLHFTDVARIAASRYSDEMNYASDALLYGKPVPSDFYRSPEDDPNYDGHDVGFNTAEDGASDL